MINRARQFLLLATILLSSLLFPAANVAALPANFQDTVVFSGLNTPTAIAFAPNGKIFIAEKSGIIKVFDNLQDTTPTIFADLRNEVQDYSDRGLVGLVVDPQFPTRPYVYALYTMDGPIGSSLPFYNDNCPNPDICPAGSRLSKLIASADGNTMVSEQVLLESWCQIENSHTADMLAFGSDGALYVSHGDGASFNYVDYGQDGGCNDPVNEGGALRAQDLRTAGDPVAYNGTILRLNPDTGAAFTGNPLSGNPDPGADRIIAYGFRNPYRFSIDPSTGSLWVADVGWNEWEEVDYIANPTAPVKDYGWPCYEGALKQRGYDAANIPICVNLYAAGTAQGPYFNYYHDGGGNASITGIALYRGNNFPAAYNGALFFADYSQQWIHVMMPGTNGLPDPANIVNFISSGIFPVDLKVGPNGALYYIDIAFGTVHQVSYFALNTPPTAHATANPISGALPLLVNFNGSGSIEPDPGDTISYSWDLNGDGVFGDSTAVAPTFNYTQAQTVPVKLRVTDSHGASNIDSLTIYAGNRAPIPTISAPTSSTLYNVGDVISFSGSANDPDSGLLPASALSWETVLYHCAVNDATQCHTHDIQPFTGVDNGFIIAPDHEYPSRIEFRLTATDPVSPALKSTTSVVIQPRTSTWTFTSDPSGLQLAVYGTLSTTPFTKTVIVNAQSTVSAPLIQQLGGASYQFASWSDAGTQTHTITALSSPQTFHAIYTPTTASAVWHSWGIVTQAGSPQATVVSNTNLPATIEFYESINNFGVVKGSLFPFFISGVHQPTSNVEAFWADADNDYTAPYAGKSTINRGSDAGETNAPVPLGVRDLQLHPPELSNHNTVAAFKIPQDGTYTISDIGVRRISNNGTTSRLHVYNAQATELINLTATNSQKWVTTPMTYTLSNLTAGQYIYFGVDRDNDWSWDDTEISWTITATLTSSTPQPTCTLNSNPTSMQQGSSTSLSWTTTNATSFSIDQGIGSQASIGSGSVSKSPATTTTYTGTANGSGGSVQCSTTVTVTPPVACSLSANPTSIIQGNSTTLVWTTQNATAFSINQGIGNVTPVANGSRAASPPVTTSYTGTATGTNGSAQCSTTVTVTTNPPSSCSLSFNPTSIAQGGSSSLSWTTQNATSFSIDQGIGNVTPVASGSRSVSPTTTTTYTGTTTGAGASGTCMAKLTVNPPSSERKWNSWDVITQTGTPQATVTSVTGAVKANVEFYESTNDLGITKGSLFSLFANGAHQDTFNNVTTFWSNGTGVNAYPYAGKSTVDRGSDAGETNAPSPLGVRDLQLYPPSNNHTVVAAFRIPQNGWYNIYNIKLRRVSNTGNNARLRVFNAQGTQLVSLNATNNRQWVSTGTLFTLPNLKSGQYIYFAVDRNGDSVGDATEISWTITKN